MLSLRIRRGFRQQANSIHQIGATASAFLSASFYYYMIEDLKEPHIQELGDVLGSKYYHGALDDVMRRFGAEELVNEDFPNREVKVMEFLRYLKRNSDQRNLRAATAHLVENAGMLREDQLKELQSALDGSRYVLEHDEDGNLELLLRISSEAERSVDDMESYIESRAPAEVFEMMEEAQRCLTEGDFDGAIDRARKALQKFSKGEYHDALDELVAENLIQEADDYISEWQMLYTAYGFCSEIGEHTNPGEESPNVLQAETAVRLVEECIHYILRIQEAAEEDDITLNRWETT